MQHEDAVSGVPLTSPASDGDGLHQLRGPPLTEFSQRSDFCGWLHSEYWLVERLRRRVGPGFLAARRKEETRHDGKEEGRREDVRWKDVKGKEEAGTHKKVRVVDNAERQARPIEQLQTAGLVGNHASGTPLNTTPPPSLAPVATPAVVYDAAKLASAGTTAENRGQTWRCEGIDPRVGGTDLAVATSNQLRVMPDTTSILVTRPVLRAAEWEGCQEQRRIVFTIEHFVHLEVLQGSMLLEACDSIDAVIEVAVGPARFGCRPGRDTVDLARAIAAAPRVRFCGLSAEVCSTGMAESLMNTRDQVVNAGFDCEFLTVRCAPSLSERIGSGFEVRHAAGSVLGVATTVIGRPSLDLAVLDVGPELGLEPRSEIRIATPNRHTEVVARVRQVDSGRALVSLPPEGADLTIGHVVIAEIQPKTAFDAPPVALGKLRTTCSTADSEPDAAIRAE